MRSTCVTLYRMSKMIQIRNVPDALHRTLKVRAAQAGMTLSDYLLSEIERVAEKPTLAEMMERLRSREPVELDEPPNVTIRRFRDADDPHEAYVALAEVLDAPLITMDAGLAQASGIRAAVEVYG